MVLASKLSNIPQFEVLEWGVHHSEENKRSHVFFYKNQILEYRMWFEPYLTL